MPLIKKLASAVEAPKQDVPTSGQLVKVEEIKKTVGKAATKATNDTTMSKVEWHDKDVRISRQGLFQACLQSVGLLQLNTGNTLEDYLKLVEQAAERGLEFVNRR